MRMILIVNAGSSSIKFALMAVAADQSIKDIARGSVDGIGQTGLFSIRFHDGRPAYKDTVPTSGTTTHKHALQFILKVIDQTYGLSSLSAAGHRIVHGGADFIAPVRSPLDTHSARCAQPPRAASSTA